MIMRKNQHPEYFPCFKVVGSDGTLTGYILGLEEKEKRLKAEGIQIFNGKVSKEEIWFG